MTSELARRRLIAIKAENGQDTLSIHRALQLKILKDLNKEPQDREKVFRQAYMLVRKKFPTPSPIQIPEPHKWPIYIKYIPHILSLQKVFTESVITLAPSVEFARLLSDGGMSLWERAWTNESLQLLRSAETILNQIKHNEGMLRANINVIIGLIIEGQGFTHIPESLERFQWALNARLEYQRTTPPEKYTKNDEILLYNVQTDYACCLLQQNNYIQAEPIFSSCLAKYREWGTEEEIPYEYSKYNQNMAWCSMYRRDFATAIKLAERAVHYISLATGQSPSTNSWKFSMACIVLQSGDTRRALDIHKEVLEARIQQHGTSNYLTSQSYYAVGALHAMTGDLPAAEYVAHLLSSDRQALETSRY
jgi:tetratricopeptide (TPR) repeat protein